MPTGRNYLVSDEAGDGQGGPAFAPPRLNSIFTVPPAGSVLVQVIVVGVPRNHFSNERAMKR